MIEWDEKYSLGIPIIDEDHKRLIGIINKAILSKEHNDDIEELMEVLSEMKKYVQTHFAREELYMVKFNYVEYQYHKEQHLDFVTKISAYENGIINADYHIASEILNYLSKWLINHVLETDKKYVDCFKKNGIMKETVNQEETEQGEGEERRSKLDRRSGIDPRKDH
ncbi:MAG: hemerythrin family protein [Candidatus Scalindua sp.]|jgi:hemerythrin-like metal-binding protein|nr:hemerythrin family protein [Candidatus Scalindua sp.]MBT5306312.1 hemerythrin family protein [Candidatus Scalindua sp.]MBT6050147.1 hemerythrin family protein [Candidatus Scalindua sp.]MBT6230505.1 hemerythrin family protein [Candidatus Scalindua sp.]MBT6564602.1 hemerythrin family protein [Candidatus Scalindua sp.]